MKKKTIFLSFVLLILLVPNVYSQQSFRWIGVFSEVRRYDPVYFPCPGSPYYNGYPYWFMLGVALLEEPTTQPVYLNSTATDNYELTLFPGINQYVGVFYDYEDPIWGGPFPSPGPVWESQTYTFSVGDVTQNLNIEPGQLRQLPIPRVTITGAVNPTISWLPVPYADEYRVDILGLDANQYPDYDNPLFSSGIIKECAYTYTGNLFLDGKSYAVCVQARQNGESDPYRIINRSSLYTMHSASAKLEIRANGQDKLKVNFTEYVDITVSLDPGVNSGDVCDWWIGAWTPFETYWFGPALNWVPCNKPISVGQFGLFELSERSLLNTSLPVGPYRFFFILDAIPNGVLDDITWYGAVPVWSGP
jgi:hypothetical protein